MPGKAKERKLRYALKKNGYALHKSRARNWSFNNQLGYMIADASINGCVGGGNYDFSLEDIEQFARTYCNC